ncbi:MAG: ATPase [Candidatus Aenigmatarchaeota archaeon]|nr:MAG: ATPase [Candidatus Aenigmarchaeota archaeon]
MVEKLDPKVVEDYGRTLQAMRDETAKVVVGQRGIIDSMIVGLMANGHILVEGIPGLAKTLIIRALAAVSGCAFNRIQFTVDLLPTDVTGITAYNKDKGFYVVKGPIFANFVLADEINRAPPKVQSALLEAMAEHQVTIGKKTFQLPDPFFVMATQNPIESSGTYNLPEAQMDRFLFKLYIDYPTTDEEQTILNRNINLKRFEDFGLQALTNPESLKRMQEDTKKIFISDKIEKYIVRLTDASRHPEKYGIEMGMYIQYGSSPRNSINLFIASKARAMMEGKTFVTPQHVKKVAHDIMRHRIILNYEGMAESIKTDTIITELLSKVPVPV